MCDICAYADVHGSWPRTHKGTHCHKCHRSWHRRSEAHCPICCRHFASDEAAQLHKRMSRDGERVTCVDPASIRRKVALTGEVVDALEAVPAPTGVLWRRKRENRTLPPQSERLEGIA